MKLLQISVHFEYSGAIEAILDRRGVTHYLRFGMIEGKDGEGKHFGSQVYPGSMTLYQAQVPEEQLEAVLEELKTFRERKPAHEHLRALVMPIERQL